ncbi:MAG: DNA translocase FtsK 4TM domain-containing protein, partial [Myxococcales bacterium]|nr:DNA translocase FtsK 4TM domain-containing protein [Myxococcales bacterium]
MAKSKRSKKPEAAEPPARGGIPRGWGEFLGVALLAIGALMLGGLGSYQFGDGNLMGPVGRLVAAALYAGFGMAAYLIVLGVFGVGVKALLGHQMELRLGEGLGFSSATLAGCVLLHVMFPSYRVHGYTAGGLSGELLGEVSIGLFELAGTYLICVTIMTLGLIASTPLTFGHLLRAGRAVGNGGWWAVRTVYSGVIGLVQAQREYNEHDWSAEDEGEEAEILEEEDEEQQAWDELEARARAGELEAADDDEAEEAEEEAAGSKSRGKRGKGVASKGKQARKNRKRGGKRARAVIEAEEEEEVEEEYEEEAEYEEEEEAEYEEAEEEVEEEEAEYEEEEEAEYE